jgi:ribonuclease Z
MTPASRTRAPASSRLFRRRWWLAVLGVVALIAAVGVGWRRSIGTRLVAVAVARHIANQPMKDLTEGLHAGLCGSGSPMPDATRAGPCVFVIAGGRLYVVDVGEGSPRKLALMGLPPPRIDTIFLTHFHSDHVSGLGEMMVQRWIGSGSATPVEVIGPQGVEAVVDGIDRAYALDARYRVTHQGAMLPATGAGGVARPFEVPPGTDWSQVVLERDGLTVTAFNVIHTPVFPAVGYRFDYRGRSVVVSGDTSPSAWLEKNAKGADVLFHEALQARLVAVVHDEAERQGDRMLAEITADIPSYHTTPEDAARIAERAGVGHLVLYHLIPPVPVSYLDAAFLGDAPSLYGGPITVGRDGLLLSLPPDGRGIGVRDLL